MLQLRKRLAGKSKFDCEPAFKRGTPFVQLSREDVLIPMRRTVQFVTVGNVWYRTSMASLTYSMQFAELE